MRQKIRMKAKPKRNTHFDINPKKKNRPENVRVMYISPIHPYYNHLVVKYAKQNRLITILKGLYAWFCVHYKYFYASTCLYPLPAALYRKTLRFIVKAFYNKSRVYTYIVKFFNFIARTFLREFYFITWFAWYSRNNLLFVNINYCLSFIFISQINALMYFIDFVNIFSKYILIRLEGLVNMFYIVWELCMLQLVFSTRKKKKEHEKNDPKDDGYRKPLSLAKYSDLFSFHSAVFLKKIHSFSLDEAFFYKTLSNMFKKNYGLMLLNRIQKFSLFNFLKLFLKYFLYFVLILFCLVSANIVFVAYKIIFLNIVRVMMHFFDTFCVFYYLFIRKFDYKKYNFKTKFLLYYIFYIFHDIKTYLFSFNFFKFLSGCFSFFMWSLNFYRDVFEGFNRRLRSKTERSLLKRIRLNFVPLKKFSQEDYLDIFYAGYTQTDREEEDDNDKKKEKEKEEKNRDKGLVRLLISDFVEGFKKKNKEKEREKELPIQLETDLDDDFFNGDGDDEYVFSFFDREEMDNHVPYRVMELVEDTLIYYITFRPYLIVNNILRIPFVYFATLFSEFSNCVDKANAFYQCFVGFAADFDSELRDRIDNPIIKSFVDPDYHHFGVDTNAWLLRTSAYLAIALCILFIDNAMIYDGWFFPFNKEVLVFFHWIHSPLVFVSACLVAFNVILVYKPDTELENNPPNPLLDEDEEEEYTDYVEYTDYKIFMSLTVIFTVMYVQYYGRLIDYTNVANRYEEIKRIKKVYQNRITLYDHPVLTNMSNDSVAIFHEFISIIKRMIVYVFYTIIG